MPLAVRVGLAADIAEAVAQAHDVGVLHGNLGPHQVMIGGSRDAPRARLAGFATGGPGVAATAATDIQALGLLLYQLAAAELGGKAGPGWESRVDDPLLREDIVAAMADDPAIRFSSAAMIATGLRTIEQRRAERTARLQDDEMKAALARERDAKLRRRPFVRLAFGAMALGVCGVSAFAVVALVERNEARRQFAAATAVSDFLNEDLLRQDDPYRSGNPNQTLLQATLAAEPKIEQRLARQPRLAVALYVMLGAAFASRNSFDEARHAYQRAAAILTTLDGASSIDVVIIRLRQAVMEATSAQAGSVQRCQNIIAEARPLVGMAGARKAEAEAWLLFASAQLEGATADRPQAARDFAAAAALIDRTPSVFDAQFRYRIRANWGKQLVMSGQYAKADAVLAPMLAEQLALHGARDPHTLYLEANLAVIPLLSGDPALALQRLAIVLPATESVYGPADRATISALSERMEAHLFLGQYDEAEADGDEGFRRALPAFGKKDFYTYGMRGMAGTAECRNHKAELGEQKVREAYTISSETLGASHPLTQSVAGDLALCQLMRGHPAEADQTMRVIDCHKTGDMIGQPDYCAQMDAQKAEVARQNGDMGKANALAASAIRGFAPKPTDPYLRNLALHIREATPQPSR